MNMQRKLIAAIASGLLVFGVAACEGDATTDDTTVDDTTVDDTTTDTAPETDLEPTDPMMTPTESATE